VEIEKIAKIEEQLKDLNCKSYTVDIKLDDNNRIFIEKTANEKDKTMGFK
jgi:hypothetical protein